MNIKERLNLNKKEVMLLNTEDHRFTPLRVERETDSVIYCEKHDGILYRFFKLGPGWTGKNTRFLAVEGTPLVSYIKSAKKQAQAGLEEYLRLIWTDQAYDELLPDLLKTGITENNIGTTVDVEPIIPDEDTQAKFDELKADGVLYDADLDNLANFGKGEVRVKTLDKIFDKVPWILAGFGINYILIAIGVLK